MLTETLYLLRHLEEARNAVMDMVCSGNVRIGFRLDEEVKEVARLLARYASVPMSLADACLVRMTEQHADSVVLTLDRHFKLYRKHGRRVIPTIMPSLP